MLNFLNKKPNTNIAVSINIFTLDDIHLFEAPCFISVNNNSKIALYEVYGTIPSYILNAGIYKLGIMFGEHQQYTLLNINNILSFEVEDSAFNRGNNFNKCPGLLRPNIEWTIKTINI